MSDGGQIDEERHQAMTAAVGAMVRDGVPEMRDQSAGQRFKLFGLLALDLSGLGRSSVLVLRAHQQPVMYVRAPSGRMLAVLAMPGDQGGWGYLWDGCQWAAADGTPLAARRIAGVMR